MKRIYVLLTIGWMTAMSAFATDYFVSTTGSDANDGLTRETAFATLGAAQAKVQAGDKVYILPGTYAITESQISKEENPYKIVFNMNHKGQQGKPISFIGLTENGQRPVFDMSAVNPTGYRVTAFYVTGSYLVFRNFEVVGIQVNITDHTQSENFRIRNGSHNTFDNIACHDGMGIGFYLTNNSNHNLFLNCDGYNNYDPVSESGKGGQNDAFGCHVAAGNENNIFIGCRAWNNSDDGYDLINCYSPVTFCYSIAYKNGYDADGNARQDGNGFKAGGFGMGAAITLPEGGAPRHQVYHCLAVENKSNGIYSNHHLGGLDFSYNTSVNSRYYSNFSMVNRQDATYPDGAKDVNGYDHKLEYNLSVSKFDHHLGSIDPTDASNTLTGNSFYWDATNSQWVNSYTAEFVSTNNDRLKRARLTSGMLDPSTTLTVYQQTTYTGMGCDFSGYEDAVVEAKKLSGAETVIENTYVEDSRLWNFSSLTTGVFDGFAAFDDLVLRGSSTNNHGITVKESTQSGTFSNGTAWSTSKVLYFQAVNNESSDNIGNYLSKDKKAADDNGTTTYDRCLAFNTSVAGTCYVIYTASNNASRQFQLYFKAAGQDVTKATATAASAKTEVKLHGASGGTFFIAASIASNIHAVMFVPGDMPTGISNINDSANHLTLTANQSNDIYNLAGQRVGESYRGIVIQNGRKYVRR